MRFDANGCDDALCAIRQQLRRLLNEKRSKPVREEDEVSPVRLRVSEDGQDTLRCMSDRMSARRAEATYLHLRRLWQQGQIQRLTAEIRRAVCDQVARAGPSEALAELRRALVELSPDVRGDDVDRYRVVRTGNNLSASRINLGGLYVVGKPEAYVRCWRTEMSVGRSGHTRVSRIVDTYAER